ncbi:hypothetical protein SteCoe_21645 [Stentor coeruleus]|uniref:Peptidase S1 domain-containing protein n=1 Tax=Stentor coeruleus TaxID=5963 RepID=A0A1R2BNY5_9CILI|nr:hypothetical protein SteCoe_21645 [Stentor coeruleus]
MTEILFADIKGVFPRAKEFDQIKKFRGFAIGEFKKSGILAGTGFIFKVSSSIYPVVGLVLTAAHIFIEIFDYKPEPLEFIIGQESYQATPLKTSLDWSNLSAYFIDPITNCPISVPEDWVVCELRQILGQNYSAKLVSLSIADYSQPLNPALKTRLIGFPKMIQIDNLQYMSPEAKDTQLYEVKQCFLECNKLIVSKGELLNTLDMICTTCTSASGMSGSPLLIKEHSQYKVIGLLHGGPTSIIHYLVSKLLSNKSSLSHSDLDALINYIELKRNLTINKKSLKHLTDYFDINVLTLQRLSFYTEIPRVFVPYLHELYCRALFIEFATGNQLKYNLCVPLKKFYLDLLDYKNQYP